MKQPVSLLWLKFCFLSWRYLPRERYVCFLYFHDFRPIFHDHCHVYFGFYLFLFAGSCLFILIYFFCLTCLYNYLQEFNIEKLQLVEAEKKKIRQEYERKEKQVDVRKKMWGFNSLNYVFLNLNWITSFSMDIME